MADDLVSDVLDFLSDHNGSFLTSDAFPSVPFITVKSALDRLGSRELITYRQIDREEAILTEEAKGIATNGSHEAKVFEAVRKAVEGLKIEDLTVCGLHCMPGRISDDALNQMLMTGQGIVGKESAKVGQGKAFKEGWIRKEKDLLKANVFYQQLRTYVERLTLLDGFHCRYQPGTASDHSENENLP